MIRRIFPALALLALLSAVAEAQPSPSTQAQSYVSPANFRNLLVGSDFGTNPYQLGTSAVTGITTTATYHADQWFAYTSASSAYLTRITSGLPIGFSAGEQLARTAGNTNTTALCLAYILTPEAAVQMQGQPVILSYYAAPAANFSGTGVQPILTMSTAAAGTPASLIAGTWTGQQNLGGIPAQALQATPGSYARYQVGFNVPVSTLGAAVQFCFNGVGTAGTTDGVIFEGMQLEISPTPILVPGVVSLATPFERRPAAAELSLDRGTSFGASYPSTPTSGGTVTAPVNTGLIYLTPAGTLATLTVNLPALADGHSVTVFTTQIITALTVAAPSGGTLTGATLTSLAANGAATFSNSGGPAGNYALQVPPPPSSLNYINLYLSRGYGAMGGSLP